MMTHGIVNFAQCLVPACKQMVMTVPMRTAIVDAAWCLHAGYVCAVVLVRVMGIVDCACCFMPECNIRLSIDVTEYGTVKHNKTDSYDNKIIAGITGDERHDACNGVYGAGCLLVHISQECCRSWTLALTSAKQVPRIYSNFGKCVPTGSLHHIADNMQL